MLSLSSFSVSVIRKECTSGSADLGIDCCFNAGDEAFTVAYHSYRSADLGNIVVSEQAVKESEYG